MEISDTVNFNETNLSEYEQRRIQNLKRNYEILESVGIPTPKVPKFLIPKKKNKRETGGPKKEENESTFKNVTLKLFGVDKNSKITKENLPPDSELRKFISLVKDSRVKKVNENRLKKLKLKKELDVSFLKGLLKEAENFLDGFGKLFLREKSNDGKREFLSKPGLDVKDRFRYPKRNIQRKCYQEEDVSSDDEFLHCDSCDLQYKGACPHHGPMIWVCDRKTSKNDPDRAVSTMPEFLSLSTSSIPRAGLGVWSEIPLPQGFVFGPYKGRILRNRREAQKSGYAWQVRKGPKAHYFVEGEDRSASNWLRFVNCASREEQQNVVAFQYQKAIYYRTYKPILPHTEILVWYGDEYAGDMGIDTKEDKDIPPPNNVDGFECGVCNSLFTSLSALEGHRKKHPHMQSDRRHRCPHCPYSTDNKGSLEYHLLTHSGERPHRCPHCHKAFTQKRSLQDHLRTHTGERPFVCDTCGRVFNVLSNLLRHARVHSRERPFRCATCGKDFTHPHHLKRHERTHTQQKPYRCPHCPHRSSVSSSLHTHIITKHTRDFKHKCSACSKGFLAPSKLRRHIEKHHPTDTNKESTSKN